MLRDVVDLILSRRTDEEVLGVDASRVVAAVADVEAIRHGSVDGRIDRAVRGTSMSVDEERRIAGSAPERPAASGRLLYAGPEALRDGVLRRVRRSSHGRNIDTSACPRHHDHMAAKRIPLDNENPLRSLRVALGLTQEQAADVCGVQRSALGNAELRGEGVTVRALVDYLRRYGRTLRIVAIEGAEEKSDVDA